MAWCSVKHIHHGASDITRGLISERRKQETHLVYEGKFVALLYKAPRLEDVPIA